MQVLDAESLASLMASVNLHSSAADTPDKHPDTPQAAESGARPGQDQTESHLEQSCQNSDQGQSMENAITATGQQHHQSGVLRQRETEASGLNQEGSLATALRQRALADCPLPFAAEAATVAATPARGRRPARRVTVPDHTPEVGAPVATYELDQYP